MALFFRGLILAPKFTMHQALAHAFIHKSKKPNKINGAAFLRLR
jgi:hypothetical protein